MPITPKRPIVDWSIGSKRCRMGERTWVMAVLNLTPDSFYAGSRVGQVEEAVRRAESAIQEGADILDLGAESTRPGAQPLSPSEEQARLLPALRAVRHALPAALLSVDSRHAETARAALDAGASVVNDVTGLSDPKMAKVVSQSGCGVVLMHLRGEFASMHRLPPLDDPVRTVRSGLASLLARAIEAGVRSEQIVLDPGFGFGKNLDENFPLLAHFEEFASLGRPLLAGVSRKSFIGHALGDAPPEERLHGTVAATTAAILGGAHIVRVHDVRPAVDAARVADKILQPTPNRSQ